MTFSREFDLNERSSGAPSKESISQTDNTARRPSFGPWIVYYVVGAIVMMSFVLFVLWASSGFQMLGIGDFGVVALILGSLITTALGVALMGLVFYSDRSGTDEFVFRTSKTKQADRNE